MKTVAFMGAKNIGYQCLRHLSRHSRSLGIEIACVLTNSRGNKIIRHCEKNGISLLNSLTDFCRLPKVDIIISVQYHKILNRRQIDRAKQIAVNLHLAPLPEYRGCNQFSFAIIDGAKTFGATLHKMEKGIDSGPIIAEKRFPVPKNCFVKELHQLTSARGLDLFREQIGKIINGGYLLSPQQTFADKRKMSFHLRKEIETIKKIDLSWSRAKIERHIRATAMPGFSPPYAIIGGKKVDFIVE